MKYYDNTRISSFKDCPRQFYFRHIRHWRKAGNAPALAFGLAWHDAMDVIWGLASSTEADSKIVSAAMSRFLQTWTNEGFPDWDEWSPELDAQLSPRTPGIAAEMLQEYISLRRPYLRGVKMLGIEQPFAVPIHPKWDDVYYVGRLDKVIENDKGDIIVGEHKTTTSYAASGPTIPFRYNYIHSWSPNSQIDGYLHAAHSIYGSQVTDVFVDAALVHKKIHDGFKFIPVSRALEMLDGFLVDTHYWIDLIEKEKEKLDEQRSKPTPDLMMAFYKNTNQCDGKYSPCSYKDICKFCPNPETIIDPPEGFIEDKWEPFNVLELDKIGLSNE